MFAPPALIASQPKASARAHKSSGVSAGRPRILRVRPDIPYHTSQKGTRSSCRPEKVSSMGNAILLLTSSRMALLILSNHNLVHLTRLERDPAANDRDFTIGPER